MVKKGIEGNPFLEIVGGVDETFLDEMVLVFMDLPTGYLIVEEYSKQRTIDAWKELIMEKLKSMKSRVLYIVSDRAQALISLALKNVGCKSIPDLFHIRYDLTKRFSLAIENKANGIYKKWDTLRIALSLLKESQKSTSLEISSTMKDLQQVELELDQIKSTKFIFKESLQQFSLLVHPYQLEDSSFQSVKKIESKLKENLKELQETLTRSHIADPKNCFVKIKKQIHDISSVVGVWEDYLEQQLISLSLSKIEKIWLKEYLIPKLYWDIQAKKTRSHDLRIRYEQALKISIENYNQHITTKTMDLISTKKWEKWSKEIISKFKRASSAVEGRNGVLSQMNHNGRGIQKGMLKVMSIIHNFDTKDEEQKTSAQKLFKQEFPDLFEIILEKMIDLPLPRTSQKQLSFNTG